MKTIYKEDPCIDSAAEKYIFESKKTWSLGTARESTGCKYDKSADQVMTFKYLGVNIRSNENLKDEMTEAATMSGYLYDIIWRKK